MKNCKFCNELFENSKYRETFCSHRCQGSFNIKDIRGIKPKTGEHIICAVCNAEFYAPRYRVKTGKVKYCSRSCLAKEHLKKYSLIYGFKSTGKPKHTYKCISVNGKQVREHRWIMEQHLGRKLESWEHVHHKNDDPSDNNLDNLVVLSNSDHQKEEYKFRKSIISSSSL